MKRYRGILIFLFRFTAAKVMAIAAAVNRMSAMSQKVILNS